MTDLIKTEELDAPVKPNLVEDLFEVDPQNPNTALADIDSAIVVPLQANMEMWNPVSEGDSIIGLLNGFTVLQMQSLSDPTHLEDVECAVLYTPKDIVHPKTGEIQGRKLAKIGIAAKRAVSFLKSVPRSTMWTIRYTGEQKNKNNQFKSKTFEFFQMTKNKK